MAKRTCSIPDCGRLHEARGWCNRHYQRWLNHGDPLALLVQRAEGTAEDRFWPKVDKCGPVPQYRPELGPCWVWLGARNQYGYGNFWDGQRYVKSHRFAYKLLIGPIPDDRELDHLCRVRHCLRPEHLQPVTDGENKQRSPLLPNRYNASKTHCKHGHPFDEANTYVAPSGRRQCRACSRQHSATYKKAKRA